MLRVEGLSKSFGDNRVLSSVDLEVGDGEIHGLVGENGSGKTTLLNILMGHPVIRQTGGFSGRISLEGKAVELRSPGEAIQAGLGMVHQEFALLPGLTVAQNIQLGRENLHPLSRRILGQSLAAVDRKKDSAEAAALLRRLGLDLDTSIRSDDLSVNLKQYVETAREIGRGRLRVLILDEPTAALDGEDARRLLSIIEEIARQGVGIIFVSHRLDEVLGICHRITVLRDGEVAADLRRGDRDFALDAVALAMVGRSLGGTKRDTRPAPGPEIMRFEDFAVDMPGEPIRRLNLNVRRGEIAGIAGLAGHGKLALGYGLMGAHPARGRVLLDRERLDIGSPAGVLARGICFLPDDRRRAGLLLDHSVVENIIFTAAQHKDRFLKLRLGPLSTIDWKASRQYAQESVERLDIRCRDLRQPVDQLSGGNQQKVCLARAIALEPRVLMVAEPTRGVDIGAREAILEALLRMNEEQGTSILYVSSELAELKQVCDRILVMYEGEILAELPPQAPDLEFSLAMGGKRPPDSLPGGEGGERACR